MTTPTTNQRLEDLKKEQDKRDREGLKVYRPSPQQIAFHLSSAKERIVRGGKRSGKSVCAAMEFASQVTGIPLIGADGKPIPLKQEPPTPDGPRQYWTIGWDTKHAGTLYRLLFTKGMGGTFRVIKDQVTGQWRTWNRSDPADRARYKQSCLSEPLIPERLIVPDSWDWAAKSGHEWNSVRLKTGAHLFYFPSSARSPKQGVSVNVRMGFHKMCR